MYDKKCKGEFAMAKMGRPPVDVPREKRVNLRFTEDEYARLKAYASKHKTTMTKAIRKQLEDIISDK